MRGLRAVFSAKILTRDFQISIVLPWSYRSAAKRYPAVYVTDADTGFGRAKASG